MMTYESGYIRKLANSLAQQGVAPEIAAEILAGGEVFTKRIKPEKKAEWMQQAMARMDTLLDADTRQAVRESCACCLGGKRLKLSRQIARDHATLAERLAAANAIPFVFGHSVTLEADGRILVRFAPEGLDHYQCVCLRKAKTPMSDTYCYCCAGHAKHHLQIALGCRLTARVHTSALSSDGTAPCSFLFQIES